MADEFQVGDVVVCVDVSHVPHPKVVWINRGICVLGRLYRVRNVCIGPISGEVFLKFDGYNHGPLGCLASRFRKLPKADAQFTREIRACRPAPAAPVSA